MTTREIRRLWRVQLDRSTTTDAAENERVALRTLRILIERGLLKGLRPRS